MEYKIEQYFAPRPIEPCQDKNGNWISAEYTSVLERFKTLEEFLKKHSEDFFPPLLTRKSFSEYLESIRDFGGVFYAVKDSRVIGLVTYLNHHTDSSDNFYDGSAYIPYIATEQDFRRKGIMQSLMEATIIDLRKANSKKVKLETWSTNQRALALFDKLGFKEVKRIKDKRAIGVDDIKLELIL